MKITIARPLVYSLILHMTAAGMLLVSLENTPEPHRPASTAESRIIDAVAVDDARIEEEIARIQDMEQQKENEQIQKQQELQRQLNELQQESTAAEQKRVAEEKRLADLKKQQEQETQRRRAEEEKLAQAKKEQETLKKQQEEAERKRREEEQRLAEARKQREEEERKRQEQARLAEEARQKKEAEEALQRQMAEEQKRAQAAQDREDMNVINSYVGRIADAIEREFNTAGLPAGLSCIFQIRMIPGGDIVDARIVKTSGNSVFDSRADIALKRAAPLPVPDNPRIFAKMREIRLTFAPN